MKQVIQLSYDQFPELVKDQRKVIRITAVYQAENALHVLVKVEKYDETALSQVTIETNADEKLPVKIYVVCGRKNEARFTASKSESYLQLSSSREFHADMQAVPSVCLYRKKKQPAMFNGSIQIGLQVNIPDELYKIPGIKRETLTYLLIRDQVFTDIMFCLNQAGIFTEDENENVHTLVKLTNALQGCGQDSRKHLQALYFVLADKRQLTRDSHHTIIKECLQYGVIRPNELLEVLELLQLSDRQSTNNLFKCLRGLYAFVRALPKKHKKNWLCHLLKLNPTSQQLYAFYGCWKKAYSRWVDEPFFQRLIDNIEIAPVVIKACHALYSWSPEWFTQHHQLVFDGQLTYDKIKFFQKLNLGACIKKILHKHPDCIEALEFGYEVYVFKDAEHGSGQHARMADLARAIVENRHLTAKLIELKQIKNYLEQTHRSPSTYLFEPVAFHHDFLNLVASAKVKPGKNTCLYGSWFAFRQTPSLEQRMDTIREAHKVTIEELSRLNSHGLTHKPLNV